MDRDETRDRLKEFVEATFIRGRGKKQPGDDDSFFENEIIDSTGVLELVLFIEETFGFRVEDEDIVPENLDSIGRLVTYVQFRTKTMAGA